MRPGPIRVAVLGATIEFRDLLAEFDRIETTLFERDRHFLQISNLLRLANVTEILVEGDWRETLSRVAAGFDFVLSDFTSGNLPYEDRSAFYHHIADVLQPGGLFIDRVLIPARFNDLTDLTVKYVHRPANLRTINDFSSDALFLNSLNRSQGVVDTTSLYEQLDVNGTSLVRRLAALARIVTPEGQRWYYGRPDSLAKHLSRLSDFDCLAAFPEPPDSVYYGHVHQLVLSRRR